MKQKRGDGKREGNFVTVRDLVLGMELGLEDIRREIGIGVH